VNNFTSQMRQNRSVHGFLRIYQVICHLNYESKPFESLPMTVPDNIRQYVQDSMMLVPQKSTTRSSLIIPSSKGFTSDRGQ